MNDEWNTDDIRYYDKQEAIEAIRENWINITYVSKELRKDRDVILEVTKRQWAAIQDVDEEVALNDKEIMLEIIKQNGGEQCLRDIGDDLKEDETFFDEAIEVLNQRITTDGFGPEHAKYLEELISSLKTKIQEIKANRDDEEQSSNLDDMSIEDLLAMEAETDERIKQADAEIERQKVLERVKKKMELAQQRESELQRMKQNRDKQPQQLGQDIELH